MVSLSTGMLDTAGKKSAGVSHFKYKRRKVSANRVFPQKCRRDVPRDDPQSVEGVEFTHVCECSAPRINPLTKDDGFVTVKQDFPDGCVENDPHINPPKDGVVVTVKQEFPDGCVENDAVNPHPKEDCVVSSKQEFTDVCLKSPPPLNSKMRKVIIVPANRTFPPGCGRNASRISGKPNESDVSVGSVENMNFELDDASVGPPSAEQNGSRMELGDFEVSKSSNHIVSLDSPEALRSESTSSLEVLNRVEELEPVEILETMVVKCKTGDVASTRRTSHDDVSVENPEAEADSVLVKPPAFQNSESTMELSTSELTKSSGQTGSSQSPKSWISETTNVPEVLDWSEAPDPTEVVDNHNSLNTAELMSSKRQAEFETTGSVKNFNQTKLFSPMKNLDEPKLKYSQPEEKELPSSLLQLPGDSVLPVMHGQPQVSDQPHASDHVETVEKNMHKKYPPRRRVSACRDFPPHCALNSSCSIIEVDSFRDACVDNGNTGQQFSSEHTFRDHAKQMTDKIEGRDMFGDKAQVNLHGVVEVKTVQHVLVREEFGSELKQEYRDVTSIQTPCENVISGLDLEPPSSSRKIDREIRSSGKGVGMELVEFANEITLKRKLPGMSSDESFTANKFEGEENVESEFSSKRIIVLALMAAKNCPWNVATCTSKSPGVCSPTTGKRKEKKHEGSRAIICQSQIQENKMSDLYDKQIIVQALMAAENCPWNSANENLNSSSCLSPVMAENNRKKSEFMVQDVTKSVRGRKKDGVKKSKEKHSTKKTSPINVPYEVVLIEDDSHTSKEGESPLVQTSHSMDLSLIPFGLHPAVDNDNGNGAGVTRNIVRETLRLFQGLVRKLLQDAESKSKPVETNRSGRADLVAGNILKEKNKWVNTGKPTWGKVPGVEVGDEFHYRVELAIIGLHRPYQSGIDYSKMNGEVVATSIVSSGGYADVMDSSDVLVYSGQGGLPTSKGKKAEDQKLERGNLALKNSIEKETPVRVIRGYKEMDSRGKLVPTYTYDGLYSVEKYWEEKGCYSTNVFKFQLRRIPGQPELAIKEVKKSTRSRVREGLCVKDISQGKEKRPICAINTVDDEKPPPFNYIATMTYPSCYDLTTPDGCNCIDGCSDSDKCSCALKNGEGIPYNHDGAIVEAKPLVYECGPSCKCPPSCHNRVSQHGIKFQLEIFKTESRGWGVRSLNSIPSGSFICEYTGELLEDKEAEERTGNDEYLFDIGHNYNDPALSQGVSNLMSPDLKSDTSCVSVEGEGFTIDAAHFGSVGRFINHSCSPNLYAQNVLYDHGDKRMPHIMLFAAENIPPLQELAYHYNYELDQVRDSDGKIKQKSCYCGSHECSGRMY